MPTPDELKHHLLAIAADMRALLTALGQVPGLATPLLERFDRACQDIERQTREDILRVAVVGPIKSGKSSFANALFGGDYLKRGAGVVTSIVTRVRRGDALEAELTFKSWKEVNADMEQALVLLPAADWHRGGERFDIRRDSEREALKRAVASLGPDQLVTQDARNVNSVLLSSYLKGYGRVCGILGDDNVVLRYDAQRFAAHRDFVGDDSLAVYLKDIGLQISTGDFPPYVEMADCQGSDSPNPLHMAMIQDYLLRTNLILYVISSRTGLRRADLRFLSIIKKMGILDNMLFVLNVDLSEHDSLENLQHLRRRVTEELALMRPDPEVFAFSALYNLFRHLEDGLPEKDQMRLQQWRRATDLAENSEAESRRFQAFLQSKIRNETLHLLYRNHAERMLVMVAEVAKMVGLGRELVEADTQQAQAITARIRRNQEQMTRIRGVIRSTLEGGLQKIKQERRFDVDRFFDPGHGEVLRDVIGFIRAFRVASWTEYQERLRSEGFATTLYHVFQEFRQALDVFMTENVNPRIVAFVRQQEKVIFERLMHLAEPYRTMVREAVADFDGNFGTEGFAFLDRNPSADAEALDMDQLRRQSGVELPPASAVTRYSAKVKTEAILRLGAYRFWRGFKKLLRQPVSADEREAVQALEDGVARLRRETEQSVRFHFKDYRENIKFGYIFKLVESASDQIVALLLERFQAYEADLSVLVTSLDTKHTDRVGKAAALRSIEGSARHLYQRALTLRNDILQS
jgi:hypothetical protein